MFSYEIYKISKNTSIYKTATVAVFWGLTRVFKTVRDKNRCDCLQYIPHLAEKGICCRKIPEASTVGAL